ncbi:MAG: enoyl-CoA hydratase/isomerase family protein [Mycobacterium sp.]|nr:MAG: enoyl-CoA hydratase/isomerase family protein [Mycobacterium sp.]
MCYDSKGVYDKRGEVAYITLNRPEIKNAIDIESHELLCHIWRDFRDDLELRVAVITAAGDAFTAGADLKTHAPEWQTSNRWWRANGSRTGCAGTRRPLSRITNPVVAAINSWCVGHGVELAMAVRHSDRLGARAVRHRRGASQNASGRRRHPVSGQHLRCRSGAGVAADRGADLRRAGADREHGCPSGA